MAAKHEAYYSLSRAVGAVFRVCTRSRQQKPLPIVTAALLVFALLGCETPQTAQPTAWETLPGRSLQALGGRCDALSQPAPLGAAASASDARVAIAVNKAHAVQLHPIQQISFAVDPQLRQRTASDRGGLLAFTAPASGIYWVGSMSLAWVDLVEAGQKSVMAPQLYRWTDFCGRRMKAGIFELHAAARYLIQISASPDATVELFVSGPLN